MPKIKISRVLLFAGVLITAGLMSLSVVAKCPETSKVQCPETKPVKCNTGCQQVVQKRQADPCGCPAVTVNCVCNNIVQQKNTCSESAPASTCGQASRKANTIYHTGYTLEPTPEQYAMSARQKMFEQEVVKQEEGRRFFMGSILKDNSPCERCDKNGSIFGGGPCKSCDKNGSIFGGSPCENCDKNGSIFGGSPCEGCDKNGSIFRGAPCEGRDCPTIKKAAPKQRHIKNYVAFDDDLYKAVHRECRDLAPLELSWVDFRLKKGMSNNTYSRKLGNYRFRIFGCRRDTKNAILNEGRILEKDMRFIEIFDDMVSDCYNVVKVANDLCIREDSPLPEYVLTAEITDFFMNVCDEYDWDATQKKEERVGSSEMTVVWRIMDTTKTNVLWKGKSVGYGEVWDGEYNGELMLIERAFADAVDNLRAQPDFEEQLAQRVSPEEMARQRQALIELQRRNNPAKCQYEEVIKQTTIVVEERPIGYIREDSGSVSTGHSATSYSIIENSGVRGSGHVVIEDSGVTGSGHIIVEDSGSVSTGHAATSYSVMENSGVSSDGYRIIEDSGVVSTGHSAGAVSGGHTITTYNVSETSGVASDGYAVIEDSGTVSTGHSAGAVSGGHTITTYSVSENSGVTSDGYRIIEDSGAISSGYGASEGWINVPLLGVVTEASGASSAGYGASTIGSISTELVEVVAADPKSGFVSAMFEKDKLCIVERPEYDNMGPENVYKVRASIVSVKNAYGRRGAGLVVSENFVMTSADLIDRRQNVYNLETINGKRFTARAVRINPKRNTALLMLDTPTEYTPLSLGLVLPPVGKGNLMTLGMLNLDDGEEAYLENSGKVSGYRYSDDGTAEIVIDTFVQSVTVGGALIDDKGRIVGISHSTRQSHNSPDLFLPMETAMKSLGVEICGKIFPEKTPRPQKSWRKPVSDYIEGRATREPEVMKPSERK